MPWKIKKFSELTTDELYKILQLRVEIFVLEQNCPYQDIDGLDYDCLHLYLEEEGEILATCRIIPQAAFFADAVSFGRVAVKKSRRGHGLAREMMKITLTEIRKNYGDKLIRIHGQSYLQGFYESLGFKRRGEEFLEDEIPHLTLEL